LALAYAEIEAKLVADMSHQAKPGTLSDAPHKLHRQLMAAKNSAFADLLDKANLSIDDPDLYDTLFNAFGQGGPVYSGPRGNLCAICHTEVNEDRGTQVYLPADPKVEGSREIVLCGQCRSLGFYRVGDYDEQEILPYQLAHAETLFIEPIEPPLSLPEKYLSPDGGSGNPPWDEALRTFGFNYEFRWADKSGMKSLNGRRGHLLYLDAHEFKVTAEPGTVYGFWPLTRLTPWQNNDKRTIRDFHVMARYDATGLQRYGVLRMDVDT
jgi:hypothetical protein